MNPNFNANGGAICPKCGAKVYVDVQLAATLHVHRGKNNTPTFIREDASSQGNWYISPVFCINCDWTASCKAGPKSSALENLVERMGEAVNILTEWYCNDGPFEGAHINTEHPLTLNGQETYELAINSSGLEEDRGPDASILEGIQ